MKFYTGVGSRETPIEIQKVMVNVAEKLASAGWTLRSGAAVGADQAFELGWFQWFCSQTPWPPAGKVQAEIYIPWEGYEKHDRDGCFGANIDPAKDNPSLYRQALVWAEQTHPNWAACKRGARAMHARNVYQVMGQDLDTPSKMLIAWTRLTRAGEPMGGTATAIRLAQSKGIQTFNLNKPEDLARIQKYLGD